MQNINSSLKWGNYLNEGQLNCAQDATLIVAYNGHDGTLNVVEEGKESGHMKMGVRQAHNQK